MSSSRFSFIDLFCGCGGNSQGFLQTRNTRSLTPLLALDIDPIALSTYQLNMPNVPTLRTDIQTITSTAILRKVGIDRGELGCLVASPPCQTYSRNNRLPKNLSDERNTLYKHTLRIIRWCRPYVVFMENVPEMKTYHDGIYHEEFIRALKNAGYRTAFWVINAADYGVPQFRSRLIYLAYRKVMKIEPTLPSPTHSNDGTLPSYVTIEQAIADLPSRNAGDMQSAFVFEEEPAKLSDYAQQLRPKVPGAFVYNHQARELGAVQLERVRSLKEGQALKDLPEHLKPKNGYKASYGRMWRNRPSNTLTTYLLYPGSGRFSHYEEDRVITIREALRLQSFDDTFAVCGIPIEQSTQVGNAVPPLLAAAFKDRIVSDLEQALG